MKNKKFMSLLLLLLGVGFAAVSTTLLMNGNVSIMTDNDNYDVIFTSAVLDNVDISETAITEGGKKITFETKDLIEVDDISNLLFEITNNSTMYDAEVSIDCTIGENENVYYKIIKTVDPTIRAGTIGTGEVKVKLLKAPIDDITETFTCTLTAKAIERTDKAERVMHVPRYFALGNPTTSSSTDYTALTYSSGPAAGQSARIFAGLNEEGNQRSLCIVKNGTLVSFKQNNFAEEVVHLKEVYGDINCNYSSVSGVISFRCIDDNLYCRVSPDEDLYCADYNARYACTFYSDSASCYYYGWY